MYRLFIFVLILTFFQISNTSLLRSQTDLLPGWQAGFNIPGANNSVDCFEYFGGELYVGGLFTQIGGNSISYLAKWSGTNWSAVGTGVNGRVSALIVFSGNLYAAGSFTLAGGISANRIAKWDGSNWTSLGTGMNSTVSDLAYIGSDLYAAGGFSTAGGVSALRIAKWNGTTWSALGSGVSNTIYDIEPMGSDLYVCGQFPTAGGITVNGIAKWNGSSWSALGTGMNLRVTSLAVIGTTLYAGGYFTTAGGISANRIAKWNGTTWSALSTGANGNVEALTVYNGNLIAGGSFSIAGGVNTGTTAKWNGTSWSYMGEAGGNVFVLDVKNSELYAAGSFSLTENFTVNAMSKYNGTEWLGVGNGDYVENDIKCLAFNENVLFAGGSFTSAGNSVTKGLAKWNGNSWTDVGGGVKYIDFFGDTLTGTIYAMDFIGNDLYIGGQFSFAGSLAVNNIAKWNGTSWSTLGTGVDGYVKSITHSGNDLYVSGVFQTAGGLTVNSIAKWNGTSWSQLGSGFLDEFLSIGDVRSLTFYNGDLYAGGSFYYADNDTAIAIAKWNGSTWSDIPGVLADDWSYGYVNNISTANNGIYVSGYFLYAGINTVNNIAKWDGSSWSALGTGMEFGSINTTHSIGNTLYIGGNFSSAGGTTASNIAKWDGTSWFALGSGTDDEVYALVIGNTDLYAGGKFTTAGGLESYKIAQWHDDALPVDLMYFYSEKISSRNVKLKWATSIEFNNSGFEIFRMHESGNWFKTGFVPGKGTSNQQNNYEYFDDNLSKGKYFYRIKQIDYNGNYEFFNLNDPIFILSPENSFISQNYPNPSNPNSIIEYNIPLDSWVKITMYDILGKEVKVLVNEFKPADYYSVSFDGRNLSSGVYFYRIQAGEFTDAKKMILVK